VSDLFASIQINVPSSGLAIATPLRAAPAALVGDAMPMADFANALVELLAAGPAVAGDADRQTPAMTGKDLPEDEERSDPLLAWSPVPGSPPPLPSSPPLPDAPVNADTVPVASGEPTPDQALVPTHALVPLVSESLVSVPLTQAEPTSTDLTLTPAVPGDAALRMPTPAFALPTPTGDTQGEHAEPATVDPAVQPAGITPPAAPALAALPASAPTGRPAAPLPLQATGTALAQPIVTETAAVPAIEPGATAIALAIDGSTPTPTPSRFEALVGREGALPLGREAAQPTPTFVALQPTPSATSSGLAAQVFASAGNALSAAPADPLAEPLGIAGLTGAEPATRVQALAGTAQPALDMSGNDWPGQMIERIAALRDSAEVADTRIKLAPENLGALEVSIRRDGDRIHVHFTADNPAARQLIADATPRLAELADARGLKLGQASVDGGNAGNSPHGSQRDDRQHATAHQPSIASQSEPAGDDRIA
jgi:flagellar hook-length control protein FliK